MVFTVRHIHPLQSATCMPTRNRLFKVSRTYSDNCSLISRNDVLIFGHIL